VREAAAALTAAIPTKPHASTAFLDAVPSSQTPNPTSCAREEDSRSAAHPRNEAFVVYLSVGLEQALSPIARIWSANPCRSRHLLVCERCLFSTRVRAARLCNSAACASLSDTWRQTYRRQPRIVALADHPASYLMWVPISELNALQIIAHFAGEANPAATSSSPVMRHPRLSR